MKWNKWVHWAISYEKLQQSLCFQQRTYLSWTIFFLQIHTKNYSRALYYYWFSLSLSLHLSPLSHLQRKRQADSDVTMYMSKTSAGKIQMVFTDSNGGSSSGQAAIRLALEVEDDIAQSEFNVVYHIHSWVGQCLILPLWMVFPPS